MDTREPSPARILAPLALIAFALALLIILASADGGGHSSSNSAPAGAERILLLGEALDEPRPGAEELRELLDTQLPR